MLEVIFSVSSALKFSSSNVKILLVFKSVPALLSLSHILTCIAAQPQEE